MAPLDQDALGRLRRTMGSETEFRSMLEEFLTASSRVQADLEAAVAGNRLLDAERAAHTLKSMARMVGAFALADLCAAAESKASQGPLAARTVSDLRDLLRQAQEAVRECLA